ncbi:MAG: PatB family C-S lyase [Clostridia bacterium]|nr:PatB family C-S lyase [Clostridia bacterium]
MVNFDKTIERRGTDCVKFDALKGLYGREDLISMWIADMDFPVPEEVTAALKRRAEHPVYGYNIMPEGYFEDFAAWVKKRHDWEIKPEWTCHTPGVLSALSAALLSFTAEGDGVLIQPPVYFPFSSTVETLGRKVINNQLIYKDGYFTVDFDDMEEKAKQAKLFILCSPHNPAGRVWTREELARMEDICRRNDLLVFSDEIHADIVYTPAKHIVFAALSDWSREHSIVAMAPSKTFNIAGLGMSFITVPNEDMRKKFQTLLGGGLHVSGANAFGIVAAQAAYRHGEAWLEELLEYLRGNMELLDRILREHAPQIRVVRSEATYILFLDVGALGMTPDELKDFFVNKVGAALNVGATFGPGGESFMRINIATQRENIKRFAEKLCAAVAAL